MSPAFCWRRDAPVTPHSPAPDTTSGPLLSGGEACPFPPCSADPPAQEGLFMRRRLVASHSRRVRAPLARCGRNKKRGGAWLVQAPEGGTLFSGFGFEA